MDVASAFEAVPFGKVSQGSVFVGYRQRTQMVGYYLKIAGEENGEEMIVSLGPFSKARHEEPYPCLMDTRPFENSTVLQTNFQFEVSSELQHIRWMIPVVERATGLVVLFGERLLLVVENNAEHQLPVDIGRGALTTWSQPEPDFAVSRWHLIEPPSLAHFEPQIRYTYPDQALEEISEPTTESL